MEFTEGYLMRARRAFLHMLYTSVKLCKHECFSLTRSCKKVTWVSIQRDISLQDVGFLDVFSTTGQWIIVSGGLITEKPVTTR